MKNWLLKSFCALLFCTPLSANDCLIVVEGGEILYQQGNLAKRYAPCSTFKVALSVMGFDAGLLQDAHTPEEPFKEGYADFLDRWKQPHTPELWLRNSCVWYSQVLTQKMGRATFDGYLEKLDYGNKDSSGDKGQNNGLTHCWLSSSLKISPQEQMTFLQALMSDSLPVSEQAHQVTRQIMFLEDLEDGWKLYGKTGSGFLENEDGSKDRDHQIGWFMGWMEKESRKLLFIQLLEDAGKQEIYASLRAKALVKERLPLFFENKRRAAETLTHSYRNSLYKILSPHLLELSEASLKVLFTKGTPVHKGIGGSSAVIEVEGHPIFVKKVPVTALEIEMDHFSSTLNMFNLPLFYQFGVGSAGFGAWRELKAHLETTNWVLEGKSPNFPLLYGWRLIEDEKHSFTPGFVKDIEEYVSYWEGNAEIKKRAEALSTATSYMYLFLEYIPQNLDHYLKEQLSKSPPEIVAEKLEGFESQIKEATSFMKSRKFLHMDAHFQNMLTDGKNIYYTDFGLALSKSFELSLAEQEFLNTYQDYDLYTGFFHLLHSTFEGCFGREAWFEKFQAYCAGENVLPPALDAFLKKHLQLSIEMDKFYRLMGENKSTPFPHQKMLEFVSP